MIRSLSGYVCQRTECGLTGLYHGYNCLKFIHDFISCSGL